MKLFPEHIVINRGIQGITTSDLLTLVQQFELIESEQTNGKY